MESKTFILNKKKTFRRGVRIFVKDINGKMDMRICMFTTEHKVAPKDRKKRARGIAAEYTTNDPNIIAALMRDSSYGKTFTRSDDPKGELKEQTIVITPHDAKRMALEKLCEEAGVEFNPNTPIDVLTEKYKMFIAAAAGKPVQGGGVTSIPHNEVNVLGNIQEAKEAARKAYTDKYKKDVPEIVFDDVTFLDGMANPDFDAEDYIAKAEQAAADAEAQKGADNVGGEKSIDDMDNKELHDAYFEKFGKNVAVPKKNDDAWIKGKLKE